jgi:hypothetical protein
MVYALELPFTQGLFDIAPDAVLPVEPLRVRRSTFDPVDFEWRLRNGQVVGLIFEDAADDWPAKGQWSCQYFKERFSNETIRVRCRDLHSTSTVSGKQ